MRCVFLALGVCAGVGGMERFNRRVVRCLSELGDSHLLESRVVALWDRPASRGEAPQPVPVFPAASSKVRAALAFLWRVWRMQPDVILYGHVLLAPVSWLARLLSPRSRHMLFVHGVEVWPPPLGRRRPVWEPAMVRRGMDEIIAVSRFTANQMKRAYALDGRSFRILSNAVDVDPRLPPSPVVERWNGRLRLLTVARLGYKDRYKGCDKVIRALPRILSVLPGTCYEIAGDGPLRRELECLARDLDVVPHVRFLGRVDDGELDRIYGRSHLLVMPSCGEGFGIVFLEAWAHGLPVVAGNRDAGREVVTDGYNGLCVNPDSVEEVGAAVLKVLGNRSMAERLGANGYRTVVERYTHERFRRRFAEILGENR